MSKVIRVKLTAKSIDKAIKELKSYKQWLVDKTKEFLQELANEGVQIASAKFADAQYDGTNDVSCKVEERETNKVAVMAIGSATLFIEFGTGVKYPDNHPEASTNGMNRGEYGYKLGRLENGWRYQGDPGTSGTLDENHPGYIHTYGNPANMSMYQTVRELEDKFEEIARRVYTYD